MIFECQFCDYVFESDKEETHCPLCDHCVAEKNDA